jgi:hypothetical protein
MQSIFTYRGIAYGYEVIDGEVITYRIECAADIPDDLLEVGIAEMMPQETELSAESKTTKGETP